MLATLPLCALLVTGMLFLEAFGDDKLFDSISAFGIRWYKARIEANSINNALRSQTDYLAIDSAFLNFFHL